MKILVIQLARFGDVLQSWPTLRALKRTHPDCELHVMGRERFAAAFDGLGAVDRFWPMDSKAILSPLAQRRPDLDASLEKIDHWVGELREFAFDKIINLSFSPSSSFICEMITDFNTVVAGYSRHRDGYLSIPDDASAYFYAQVGLCRANRIHLTDLFAHIAGVDLVESDWQGPALATFAPMSSVAQVNDLSDLADSIVVHIGASQSSKTLGWMKWAQIVKGLLQSQTCKVVLIGAPQERELADKILAACPGFAPVDLVGHTKFQDLFAILHSARLMVGGDSGPLHVASLTNTPAFNISFPTVSFWETGPRAPHSRVICIEEEAALPSDVCVSDILAVWREIASAQSGQPWIEARTMLPAYLVRSRSVGFELSATSSEDDFTSHNSKFQWDLIRALYMGEAFPEAHEVLFVEGVRRLVEVNQVALQQIETLAREHGNSTVPKLLDRVDEIIEQIARMVPDAGPIVRWFQTERLRMGPMSMKEILAITESLHRRFGDVLALYHLDTQEPDAQASA